MAHLKDHWPTLQCLVSGMFPKPFLHRTMYRKILLQYPGTAKKTRLIFPEVSLVMCPSRWAVLSWSQEVITLKHLIAQSLQGLNFGPKVHNDQRTCSSESLLDQAFICWRHFGSRFAMLLLCRGHFVQEMRGVPKDECHIFILYVIWLWIWQTMGRQ